MNSVRTSLSVILVFLTLLGIAGCGGSSGGDAGPPPPPPPDTTAPTVSDIMAPAGATVNRTTTLTVTANDNVAVTEVRFLLDGALLGSDSAAPYSFDWDTSAVADGDYVLSAEAVDVAGNTAQSGDVTVTVQNVTQFSPKLSATEEVPAGESAGTGQADLTVNLVTGELSGTLAVSGIVPTAAHIHDAFAGANGDVLIPLDQDPGDPGLFAVPAGATLDAAGVDRLLAGALYLNAHTAAAPGGEIRGQLLPAGFVLYFTDLDGAASVPPVDTDASGRAATTFDPATGALVVQAQTEGIDDATDAHVHDAYAGDAGAVLIGLAQDPIDPAHWFVEDGTLNAAGADALTAGRLYVNVHSPDHPGGEIRGQILPAGITVLQTDLSGVQQVPAVDSDATGFAALTLDEVNALLSIHAQTSGLDDASATHLHSAVGGVNGPVEIGLTQDGSNPGHWFVEAQSVTADQLNAVLAAGTYVNVHSPDHSGGEIRGQLIPDGYLFAAGLLEGSQEVPAVASAAGGSFAVTADVAAMTVTAHANTTGADDATAAHLHDAYAGFSGGVAVGLAQDGGDMAHWLVENAVLTSDQLTALSSGRMYLNVHTPANPGGEIRGQAAVRGIDVLFSDLSGDQVVPPVMATASGLVATTTNHATQEFVAVVNTVDANDATSVGVHLGAAGENGNEILSLMQTPASLTQWSAISTLDDASFEAYKTGSLYAQVATPAFPDGELRAQIGAPAPPPADTTAPTVTLASPGSTVSGTVALSADANDDQGVVVVRFLADGVLIASDMTAPYTADWDTTVLGNGAVTLTAEAEDSATNIGVSADVIVTVDNAAAVTFASIQSEVFGPICSGCHTGPTSGNLPSGMDLSSTADSYASLVGVASIQQSALNRVEPADPDASYLIRKLEGGPNITDSRMPQGGPFLEQATIDRIRQWISDGAPNN